MHAKLSERKAHAWGPERPRQLAMRVGVALSPSHTPPGSACHNLHQLPWGVWGARPPPLLLICSSPFRLHLCRDIFSDLHV